MPVLSSRHTVTALLFVAFALRLAAVEINPPGSTLYSDMANYSGIANDVLAGVWKASHFLPAIGFSLIVALFKRLFTNWGAALAVYHVLLSTATVWLVWKCATRAFGQTVGILSMALAAVHAPWIVFAAVALSETTFTFLLAVLLWASLEIADRPTVRWSAIWGLAFVVGFWMKGTHAFLGPMFLLGVLAWHRWSREALITVAVPISLVVGAGLAAHGVLSFETTGTFRLSAAAGGLNFVEGKCPSKRNYDSTGSTWLSPVYSQLDMTAAKMWDRPFTDSGYFMKEGLKCIGRDPFVLVQSLEKHPVPVRRQLPLAGHALLGGRAGRLYELITGPFLMAGVALWLIARWPWRREQWGELIVWALPLAALCLCVYVFKSEIRFRVPFDVWFIPMAFGGWLTRFTGR